MKQWQRLAYFLILNVLVSACTTFAVLLIWDRTQSPLPGGLISLPQPGGGGETPAVVDIAAQTAAAPPTPTTAFLTYQVQSGDTFESIAAEFGVETNELVAVNGFTKSQPLGAGEVLRIPIGANPAKIAGVTIESVAGVGDLDSERIIIKRSGEGELTVVGWTIEDEDGNIFTFPLLTLYKDGAINIFTKTGTNSVVDLFWGLQKPVWESGEAITLKDADKEVITTYQIP